MKNRHMFLGFLFVGMLFLAGCLSSQSREEVLTCNSPYIKVGLSCCLDQNYNNVCDKDDELKEENKIAYPSYNISDALDFCLKKYVYGKDGDWVNLAEEKCGALLPDELLCMFGKSKAGTFGVLCTTPSISKELEECMKKLECPDCGDSGLIEQSNLHCYSYLDRDCKFGPIGVYCLIN